MSLSSTADGKTPSPALESDVIQRLNQALDGLTFGAIEITVHNGRIVQIERREKYRFDGGK